MSQQKRNNKSLKNEEEENKDNEVWANSSLIHTIAKILTEIINDNFKSSDGNEDFKKFRVKKKPTDIYCSQKPPSISLMSYLERITKYTHIEESTLILMLIYIDKICDISLMKLTTNNIHKIILSSTILAIKYNEDDYYSNEYYAKVGGVPLTDINILESESFKLMKFNLFIKEDFYNKYKEYLELYEDKD